MGLHLLGLAGIQKQPLLLLIEKWSIFSFISIYHSKTTFVTVNQKGKKYIHFPLKFKNNLCYC